LQSEHDALVVLARVDGHHCKPELPRGEIDEHRLEVVVHDRCHAVAALEAQPGHKVRGSVHAAVELRVRELDGLAGLRVRINKKRLVRRFRGPLLEAVGKVLERDLVLADRYAAHGAGFGDVGKCRLVKLLHDALLIIRGMTNRMDNYTRTHSTGQGYFVLRRGNMGKKHD
jgi:hypothetical protein